MASPLSRGLFARAIGASGAAFGASPGWDRTVAEIYGYTFTEQFETTSLERLRALPAQTLLNARTANGKPNRFWPVVDGHFLRREPEAVFTTGEQARVPLLLGADFVLSQYGRMFENAEPSPRNWRAALETIFHEKADQAWTFYSGNDNQEVIRSASLLSGDLKGNSDIWQWMELHRATHQPTYFYVYAHPLPPRLDGQSDARPDEEITTRGFHAPGVEYALGNLDVEPLYAWTNEDREVSRFYSG
jgi:para-nitrobenzyl esterase